MFKGVVRHIRSIRNIRIDIIDIKGNRVSFPMVDIPDIIEQLKDAIDSDSIKEEIDCVGVIPGLPKMPKKNDENH